jgi:kynurenine 3-monooxygenase
MERILIVGAGLVGALQSLYLERAGYAVTVLDANPDPRDASLARGRSINLTLCDRGFAALEEVGAAERVRRHAVPCYGRVIHAEDGSTEYQPYGSRREAIWSIRRGELTRLLVEHAASAGGTELRFGERVEEVDLESLEVVTRDAVTGRAGRFRGDRLIGADGAYSAVRLRMLQASGFDYSQSYLDQAYTELDAPPREGGGFALEPAEAIHIWPRGNHMLIGFPNLDGSFTLSLHMPLGGEVSFATVERPEDLRALFEATFLDAVPLVPRLGESFFERPANSMVTIRCWPWTRDGRVALIGDAAHALVPSYGQGANSGFEDCSVFAACLEAAAGDWERALPAYQAARKPNADAIADLALEHFHELRDHVGDPEFLLRKRIERRVEALRPDRYAPLYSLVSFTRVPYVEAIERDRGQRWIIDRLLAMPGIEERLADDGALRPVLDRLFAERQAEPEPVPAGGG